MANQEKQKHPETMEEVLNSIDHACELAKKIASERTNMANQPDTLSSSINEVVKAFIAAKERLLMMNMMMVVPQLDQSTASSSFAPMLTRGAIQHAHQMGATSMKEWLRYSVSCGLTMDQWLQMQQQPLGVDLHPQQLRPRGTLQIGETGGGRDVEGSEKSKGSEGEAQGTEASPSRPRNRKSDAEKRTMLFPAPQVGNTEMPQEDGFTWRKYGQKEILGSKYPRGYYRCIHQKPYGCPAKKQVQRLDRSTNIFAVTYRGEHTCHMSLTAPPSFPPPPPQPLEDISKDMAQSTTPTQLSPSSTSVSSWLQSSMNLSLRSGGGGSGGDSGGGGGPSTSKYGADFSNTELEDREFPKTEKPLDIFNFLKNELHDFPKTELEAGDFPNTELEDSEYPKMEVKPLDFPKTESHEFPKIDIFGQGLTEPPDTDRWQNALRIELSDNKLSELPLSPNSMGLKVLMLQRNAELTKIPSSFFDHMPLLQIMDLSYTSVRELPPSFFFLEQLRELYLKGCECFMKLPPEIGNLQKLEKLDLDETQITHLPEEVQKLTNMQSLTLYFYEYRGKKNKPYSYSSIIPSGVLSKLKRLEHLGIGVNPDDERWHDNVQVILPEILGLELLETLSIYIPQLELLKLIPAYILEEVDFRFIVGRHMQRIISSIPPAIDVKFKQSDRSLKFVKGKDVPVEIKKLLRHSKALFLDRHVTIKSLSEFQMKSLEELRVCILAECKEMQTIVGGGDSNGNCDMLSHLLYLSVSHMKNLRSIWEGPTVPRFLFGMLQSLSLQSCPKLMTLFSLDFLGNLSLLKELIVKDCPKLTTLINRESSMHSAYDFLPKLRKLSLLHLPKLTSIWNRLHIGRGLKEIAFYDCPKLCSLSRKELASDALMAIKGETNWWNALKGRPSEFDRIFIPIHQEADVITQLGIYNDDDIHNCPGGPMGKPLQPIDVAIPVLNPSIHEEADVMTELGIYNDDDIDNCPGGPMDKPSQPTDVATPVLNFPPDLTLSLKGCTDMKRTLPRWTNQVRVKAMGVEGPLDDGYSWRKYGQKDILGTMYPRNYYRCTHRNVQGCLATKQVQRTDEDPTVFEITYRGRHTCTVASSSNAVPATSPKENQDSNLNTRGFQCI